MKAVVVHQYGGPEVLKFEEYPDPVPGPGEVLVRVAATSAAPAFFVVFGRFDGAGKHQSREKGIAHVDFYCHHTTSRDVRTCGDRLCV
jgi:NADPH:quinone reductase-like Zn-dependent oxidoreductase